MLIAPDKLLQNRYRVTKQIGQGGMGAVYVATDERFNSTVAIKQTLFFNDPTLRKAFEREAHLLNHLRHPALPRVSDHFIEGDGQFLVMEFIEGFDLGELLRQRGGPFSPAEVLRWADSILDALDYLHTHNPPVVHRDIKPQNLKRTPRGQIVLLDFGLAKGVPAPAQTQTSVTGSILGYSPHYAPLEQIQGTGTDARSDLYSLAATLYHLLTGAPPADALARASAIINNQPDPLRPAHLARPEVPEPVSRIMQRALAQKAALRPATAAEMRAALLQAASIKAPAVLASPRPASDQLTLLEPPAQQPSARQSDSAARSVPRERPPATAQGETTFVDRTKVVSRPLVVTPDASSSRTLSEGERRSRGKLLGLAVLLVACAAVAYALFLRPETPPANVGTQISAPLDAHTQTEAGTNAERGSAAVNSVTEGAPAAVQAPAGRPPIETTAAVAPSAHKEAATAQDTDPNASGKSLKPDEAGQTPLVNTTGGRPTLVIHEPAPSPLPGEEEARRAEQARRAEEARREEEAQREEERRRDEELRRRQMGPPPDGMRPPPPPPPDGRFPPPRRPPFFR